MFSAVLFVLTLNHGHTRASILDVAPPNAAFAVFVGDLDSMFDLVDGWKAQLDTLGVGAQGLDDLRKRATSDPIFRIFDKKTLQSGGADTKKGLGLFIVADSTPSVVLAIGLGVEDAFIKQLTELLTASVPHADIVAKQVSDRPVRRYVFAHRQGDPVAHVVLRSGYAFVSTDPASVHFAETGAFAGPELTSRFPQSPGTFEIGGILQFEHAARAFPSPELQQLVTAGVIDFVVQVKISETKTTFDGSIALGPPINEILHKLSAFSQKLSLSSHINRETDSFLRLFLPMDRVFSLLAEFGLDHSVSAQKSASKEFDLLREIQDTFRGDLTIIVPPGIQHTVMEIGIHDETRGARIVERIAKELAISTDTKVENVEIVSNMPKIAGMRFNSSGGDGVFQPTLYWTTHRGVLLQALTEEALVRQISRRSVPKSAAYGSNSLLIAQETTPTNVFFYTHADSYLFSWNDYFAVALPWLERTGLYVQDAIDLWRLAQDRWVDIAISGDFKSTGFEFRSEVTTLPPCNTKEQSTAVSDYTRALKAAYSGDVVEAKRILGKIIDNHPESAHARKAKRTLFFGGQRWTDVVAPSALVGLMATVSAIRTASPHDGATDNGFGVPEPAELADPCVKLAQEICYTFGQESEQCRDHFEAWNNPNVRYSEKRRKACALELFEMGQNR